MGKIRTAEELIAEEMGWNVEPQGEDGDRVPTRQTSKGLRGPHADKKDDGIIATSFFTTQNVYLEQIEANSVKSNFSNVDSVDSVDTRGGKEQKFVLFNRQTGSTSIVDNFAFEDRIITPIENQVTNENAVLLPSGIMEYGSDEKLVKEVADYMFSYFEPPTKFWEGILPYLVLFYWISDKFPFVPYLHFVGLTGTGKSTALESFGQVSYKAINGSGATSMASIFRLAHEWRGTLLLDEFELGGKGSEAYKSMVQLLKAGVSDMPVFRTEGDNKKQVQLYRMKSPRIFSSQEPLSDAALQSRTFVVKMNKNTRVVPLYRMNSYYEKAQQLRNKLLLWRLRHLDNVNLKAVEFGSPDLITFDRRVQQVLTPIYILSNTDSQKLIKEFAVEQEKDTKRERLEEIEGQVFVYIHEHTGNDLPLVDITSYINKSREQKGFKAQFSERKIGNIVRKVLQFNTERRSGGAYVIANIKRENELCDYYGLEPVKETEGNDILQVANEVFDENDN